MNDVITPYLRMVDSLTPALEAAQGYSIVVEHEVEGVDTGKYFEPVTQPFEVRAPQFAIDPGLLHAVFPPANSTGRYDEVLPHVALDTPILPWERDLVAGQRKTPWLALLLFRPGELKVDPTTNATTVPTVVSDLLRPSTTIVRPAIAPTTVPGDVLASTCQTLTVPGSLAQAILPTLQDLPYLAHARQVDESSQPASAGTGDGWYSVVVANRLPDAGGGVHEAHLVSLEGFSAHLAPGAQLPKASDGSLQPFQLVSLTSWRFTSIPDVGETFRDLVQKLAADGHAGGAQALLLRVPPPAAPTPTQATGASRLADGYTPIAYALASGEQTFAWYRGPLTPVVAQPLPLAGVEHITSSSQALAYVEADGVFDVSYASAFETGRCLALADGAFAPTLMAFRRASRRVVATLLQRWQAQGFGSSADLQALVAAAPVRAGFDALLAHDLGGTVTQALAAGASIGSEDAIAAAVGQETTGPVAAMQKLLADPALQPVLAEEVRQQIEPVAAWLAQLRLLAGVPFAHLVPNELMLPVESLRFFHVDPEWIRALCDGALSVGIEGSFDATVDALLRGALDDAVSEEVLAARRTLPNAKTAPDVANAGAPVAGLLLRSALVSGWPSLVLEATSAGAALEPLRIVRLSSDMLMCLFLDVPDAVTLAEPQQGLHFGIEDGDVIELRSLTAPVGHPLGKEFPTTGGMSQFLRAAAGGVGGGVLEIDDGTPASLVGQLRTALGVATLGPASFAMEMVKGAERQSFVAGDS